MVTQNPEFDALLQQMSELIWMPLDAREQFEAMLRENFPNATDYHEVCS